MICDLLLVVSAALLGSPHGMPEKWSARDEATIARVAASRGPDGVWPEFIDLERGRIRKHEARRPATDDELTGSGGRRFSLCHPAIRRWLARLRA